MSVIEPRHVTVTNPLRIPWILSQKGTERIKDYSEDNKNVKFCSYWNIHAKQNHLFDDRELAFEKKRLITWCLLDF